MGSTFAKRKKISPPYVSSCKCYEPDLGHYGSAGETTPTAELALRQSLTEASTAHYEDQLNDVKETMAKVSTYYTKLLSLRSTISMLTARSGQLQRRADKLKSTKIQYLSQIDDIRQAERARDQKIAARVVPQQTISPSTSSATNKSTSTSTSAAQQKSSPVPSPVPSETAVPAVAKKIKKKKPKAREVSLSDQGWSSSSSLKKKDKKDGGNKEV
ncbi:hypothetical protein BCR43DRAFT_137215 [Syncephalastrum racemosum]|uniref:Uncharacterized protein n=1 Tax=Syncephalastrum racemosum TaxID=13706 RepID=A0A1X2HLV4_SYNRA|nr:hypothetical protein BCR43DRAFT_137215 [Syncephalastrum racemosum]